MVNEIRFKKKTEHASVLAWCNSIKLCFTMYFSLSLFHSKQYIIGSLFQGLRGFPLIFHDSVSVIACYRAVLKSIQS